MVVSWAKSLGEHVGTLEVDKSTDGSPACVYSVTLQTGVAQGLARKYDIYIYIFD